MHANRIIAAAVVGMALTAALGVSGCGAPTASSGSGTTQVPTPLDPANKARDAAGAANNAIKALQSDVDSATPGK